MGILGRPALRLIALAMSCAFVQIAHGEVVDHNSIRSGIETADMLSHEPPGLRVVWIRWDSGFRGTDLRIGDRIVAVNGTRHIRPSKRAERQLLITRAIGGYNEAEHWKSKNVRDGATIELTVERRAASGTGVEIVAIRGKVRADRIYSENSKRRFGPSGPFVLERDGFGNSWATWYDQQVREWQKVLDRGWSHQQINSRMALASHLKQRDQVDFLLKKFPGPFANAVDEDWVKVRDSLVGRRYQIADSELAFRELGEKRAGEIATEAAKARDLLLASVKKDTITPFPTIDPIRGDRASVANKVVVLPEVGMRAYVSEGGHGYFAIGDRGWYFVDMAKPHARKIYEAQQRYRKYVKPTLGETYEFIGRVIPDPRVLVINGRASSGLEIDPIGVTIGKALFIDLSGSDSKPKFAGEERLLVPSMTPLKDTATPREVMTSFFMALKAGEEASWKALFATWWAEDWKEEGVLYRPFYQLKLDDEWVRARRHIIDKVFDVRVVYVSATRKLMKGTEFPKAPVIEEVQVEVDHVGKYDGAYHAFVDLDVHRVWKLQRRDNGPWRITGDYGL